ncbi:GNAT family N-acetyltransferase [Weissella sagaensis]|jgi:RimJ/RimL family protein N-acetyltransferase|uniref:GNAT family N-acetyltransferase n=1 Tax=Weissella sagaensis TaxID=2559928 RepID=A0ABW1RVU9_9LACO|nr:GNAT family protein [Weissella sagaensis]KAA8433566.1 GNAT family N-acetyltransferase [Weissella paramesenteroides]KAA8438615.1 GNAT family N-acetyltransferase [Weissella paramesenteroides]QDJ58915.1 N-acetyltransferase [Weissella hellenica]QEA57912.1 GNAT family N-acetyltransferase [Weissella hellenica]
MQIALKQLSEKDLLPFWQLAFSDTNAEWTKWNGPYFHDKLPEKKEFIDLDKSNPYLENPMRKAIWINDELVGLVSAYYEDAPLNQWLDVGITVYKQTKWHQGIGKIALEKWLSELFETTNLPHIGLTTWSGNFRMIALAESLQLKKEAEVRQVRFWQNKYWDSVKYGILRDEWFNRMHLD